MSELFELTEAECESLLRSGVTGRVAFAVPDGLLVLPVNYSVVDDAIVVRTSPASALRRHGDGADFAFQIDQADHEYARGWSVVARGKAEIVRDKSELEHIRRSWAPLPWADGARPTVLRLPWKEISGRRLGRGWDPMKHLPVRRAAVASPRW